MSKQEKKVDDLKSILSKIEKDYGEGIYSYAGTDKGTLEVIPLSIPSVNYITGIGGLPKGRIVEFHGMDGTFKTTLAMDAIVQCQKAGGTCAFVDAEYSFSPEYAENLGVDVDALIMIHPASAEEAFNVMERLISSNQVDLIVLDSIAALSPSAELANEFGASNMGVMARLMGQMFRKLVAKVGKSNTCMIFINQLREQLGSYVPTKTTPGGNALRFYASMRFEISKTLTKEGGDVKGVTLRIKCVKNKLAKPFLTTELEAIYGQGIDRIKDLINMAIAYGFVTKGGAWITYNGEKYQGYDSFKKMLLDNEEFLVELEDKVLNFIPDEQEEETSTNE
jgi:recombination protein RecA